MKKRHHVYRNIIASLLILFSVAGIVLMCLDLTGIISDGLGRIDTSINDGPETDAEKAIKKQVVFTFKSDYNGAIYFRNESTGDYNANKRNFSSAKAYSGNSPISPLRYYFEKEKTLNPKTFHVSVTIQKRPNRELVPYGALNEDLFSKDYTNDCYILNRGQKEASQGYETDFISQQEEDNLPVSFEDPDVAKAEQDYSKYVYDTYTTISPSLKESLLAYMKENELDNYSTRALPNALKDYFSKFLYKRPDYQVPANEDIILHFLQEKYGVCNNFASATVMMLRAKGIPARFVTGYLGKSIKDEECPVTEEAAHAWTEYYIEGYGWKYIDTTSSRKDIGMNSIDDIDNDGKDDKDQNNQAEEIMNGVGNQITDSPEDEMDSDAKLATVFSYTSDVDGALYFRYNSAGDYNSKMRQFDPATPFGGYTPISPMRFNWEKEREGENMHSYHVDFTMESMLTNNLIPVGALNESLFPEDDTNDIYIKNNGSGLGSYSTDFLYQNEEKSILIQFKDEGIRFAEMDYYDYVRSTYTTISPEMRANLISYMDENGITGSDILTLPLELVRHFSSFTYGYPDVAVSENEDIINHLLTSKKGVCNNFASATVMMLRARDIPARFVTGFLGKGKKGKLTEVNGKSAHAWVEYYVKGSGWKTLDTTPGRDDLGIGGTISGTPGGAGGGEGDGSLPNRGGGSEKDENEKNLAEDDGNFDASTGEKKKDDDDTGGDNPGGDNPGGDNPGGGGTGAGGGYQTEIQPGQQYGGDRTPTRKVQYVILDPGDSSTLMKASRTIEKGEYAIAKPTDSFFRSEAQTLKYFKKIVTRLDETEHVIDDFVWYSDASFSTKVSFPYNLPNKFNAKVILYGKLEDVNKLYVTFKENSPLSLLYNGQVQTPNLDDFLEIQGKLSEGDVAQFNLGRVIPSITKEAGTYLFEFTLTIYHENSSQNKDRTIVYQGSPKVPNEVDNGAYEVTFDKALLTTSFDIQERELTINYTGSASAKEPSSADVSLINADEESHRLADGDYIAEYEFTGQGSLVEVEVRIKNQEGEDVTSNYKITYQYSYSEDTSDTGTENP